MSYILRLTSYVCLVLFSALLITSCGKRKLKGAFQGDWYKEGFDLRAFSVRGDSIYYPEKENGYHFRLTEDTLKIQFSERATYGEILSFSSNRITLVDLTLTRDTLTLLRKPTIIKGEELSKGKE